MDEEKTFQEQFDEIQKNIQSVVGRIVRDIAKTEDGLERLRVMHENHEKLAKYDLTSLTDKRENFN